MHAPLSDLQTIIARAMLPEVQQAVEKLHEEAAAAIQQIGPRCEMSGRCCHFEEYGHRLFVTTAELAAFAMRLRELPDRDALSQRPDGGGCRFQLNGICAVHQIRPLGCRLFFCDPTTEPRLQQVYEQFHAAIRSMHDRLGIPYRYVEWREGLVTACSSGASRDSFAPGNLEM
jgi:Fe-S-cluster containining protein